MKALLLISLLTFSNSIFALGAGGFPSDESCRNQGKELEETWVCVSEGFRIVNGNSSNVTGYGESNLSEEDGKNEADNMCRINFGSNCTSTCTYGAECI